jgi:hypothetical protein
MRLLKDEHGVSTVTYAVLLPLFLLLLFGGYYVWQIVAIKQALNRATYMTVRSISRQVDIRYLAPQLLAPMITNMARAGIAYDLGTQEGFVSRELARRQVDVARYLTVVVDLEPTAGQPVERQGQTGMLFEVYARLDLPWLIAPPFLPARSLSPSARHVGSFVHGTYLQYGQKPADPESQNWRVSP